MGSACSKNTCQCSSLQSGWVRHMSCLWRQGVCNSSESSCSRLLGPRAEPSWFRQQYSDCCVCACPVFEVAFPSASPAGLTSLQHFQSVLTNGWPVTTQSQHNFTGCSLSSTSLKWRITSIPSIMLSRARRCKEHACM